MVLLGIVPILQMESLLDSLKGPWKIIISVSKLKVTACGRYIPFLASFSSSLLNQWASQKLQLGISASWRLSVFSLNWTNIWEETGQVWPLLYKKKTVAYGVALYAFLSIVELYIAVPQQKSAQTGRTKWDKFTRQGLFFNWWQNSCGSQFYHCQKISRCSLQKINLYLFHVWNFLVYQM